MAARGGAPTEDGAGELFEPAWRLRWRAPELALVLGERAARTAAVRRDESTRLRSELLVVFVLNRLGRGVAAAERAVAALRPAEVGDDPELAWSLRVELAQAARAAGAPLTGFAVLRPVLEASGVPDAVRASALVQFAACLAHLGRGQELAESLAEADRLYESDTRLDGDVRLLSRGMVRAVTAAHHRRWGDLTAAVAAAREGLSLLGDLRDPANDGGHVSARLTLELVCASLDADRPEEAVEAARPVLERPVRAPGAESSGWLRVALATRSFLPAGELDAARDLLHDAADLAARHQLDQLRAEALVALSSVHEQGEELAEALSCLRDAYTAERRRQRAVHGVRVRLAEEFAAARREVKAMRRRPVSPADHASTPARPAAVSLAELAAAETDELTGLWNREGFLRRLDAVVTGPRPAEAVTLVLFDLRRPSGVVETGDEAVRGMSASLRGSAPALAELARLGGGEFAVLLAADRAEAERWAERFRVGVADADWAAAANGARVGVRVGIAEHRPGLDGAELLRVAGQALREARTASAVPEQDPAAALTVVLPVIPAEPAADVPPPKKAAVPARKRRSADDDGPGWKVIPRRQGGRRRRRAAELEHADQADADTPVAPAAVVDTVVEGENPAQEGTSPLGLSAPPAQRGTTRAEPAEVGDTTTGRAAGAAGPERAAAVPRSRRGRHRSDDDLNDDLNDDPNAERAAGSSPEPAPPARPDDEPEAMTVLLPVIGAEDRADRWASSTAEHSGRLAAAGGAWPLSSSPSGGVAGEGRQGRPAAPPRATGEDEQRKPEPFPEPSPVPPMPEPSPIPPTPEPSPIPPTPEPQPVPPGPGPSPLPRPPEPDPLPGPEPESRVSPALVDLVGRSGAPEELAKALLAALARADQPAPDAGNRENPPAGQAPGEERGSRETDTLTHREPDHAPQQTPSHGDLLASSAAHTPSTGGPELAEDAAADDADASGRGRRRHLEAVPSGAGDERAHQEIPELPAADVDENSLADLLAEALVAYEVGRREQPERFADPDGQDVGGTADVAPAVASTPPLEPRPGALSASLGGARAEHAVEAEAEQTLPSLPRLTVDGAEDPGGRARSGTGRHATAGDPSAGGDGQDSALAALADPVPWRVEPPSTTPSTPSAPTAPPPSHQATSGAPAGLPGIGSLDELARFSADLPAAPTSRPSVDPGARHRASDVGHGPVWIPPDSRY
ncbi:diguanylate cyclase (GGDEF) domain-containing protein [Streptoalloteichus tenebrarius]|uniref:Diguanylate cyclase (GGDEF) domain-containing protein n=1 Tax=Streptoalloteichus tenebrarius (strain ATCC 17920 / DSM 40477 / JCM 4838 / CBS 697.72 / NBRC 16177 / NCIMB 11028 / NRRL B-12390 / A12253. 1 / ISP 5477) TaxID=1933 RepID=A0ABT1HW36_STRSD|nr:diguanylate cyclase [Streptoalloteichus tenebrarius]MCP2259742.1 diguanylate cyclase (GGDEF) domain-containing protein [Streptoalloteichus tenebrarius]BFF00723.1 hypothetical protein GCM10020241_23980 [Streptoalloteichus tenebrarius]